MKTNRTLTSKHSAPLLTAALGLLLAVGAGRLQAADGIWATPADGLWSNGASWIGGVVADGPDASAYFTNDLGANVVVHLDSARTNGNLVFGDGNTGTGGNWVVDNNGVAANILRLIGTAPTITVGALGAGQLVNVSAVMTGNNLTETGPGLFVPSGANTYSNLVINGGRVVFTTPNGNGSLGASTTNNIITLTNGATLIRSNVANNLLFSMNIKGTNTFDGTGAASGNLNGVFFGDGTLNMILPPGTASLTTGGNNPWNSNVWSYFTGTIVLSGGGNLRFDCNNGATTLFGSKFATFDLGETNAMNERGAAAIVPHTTFIGALRGGSGTTISANSKAGDTNLLQIGDKGLDTIFSGRINNPAVTTFTAFTKSGAGTLTLAGTNGYSGVTVVQNGRLALLLAGSISNTPTITTITPGIFDVSDYAGTWVNNLGQTLGGNGVVTGSVSMASGFISPGIGTNVGRLTFANDLSIAGTMTNLIKTAFGNTNDSVRVLGNLNLSDVTTVQIQPPTGAALIPNGTYVLFQWSGALSGNLGNLTLAYAAQAIGASITLTTNVSKQIVLTVSGNNAGAVTWRGDGAGNVWDHTTPNWKTGGGGTTVFSELDGVTFDDSGFNTPAVSITEIVTPSSVVINLTNKDYVFAGGGGKITGVTGLTKNGPGKLTVTIDNDNSGPTMINGGTVQVGVGGVTGFLGSGGLVNNGTLIYNRSDPITLATPLQGSGSTVFDGTNSSLLLTGDSVNPGTLVAKAGTIQLGDGTSLHGTFTGVITNNATLRYFYNGDVNIPNTLSGNGVVNYDTSSGSRTYTIPVNVTNSTFNGTLNISPGIRLHASDGNGGYPFGNGGQVNVPDLAQAWLDRSATNYNQAFFIVGNGWSGDNADPALRLGAMRVFNTTVTGPITLTGNARIGGSINATTITGPVSGGAFQLDVYGSNPESFILNLAPATGVNNWGATVITGGTLSILNSNGLSTNGLTMTGLGRFRLNGNTLAIASLSGGTPVNGTNALILNMSTTSSATLIVGSDGTTTFFDGLFGNGASQPLGLNKVGAGTLFLSGINTNTGPVTVNGGTLQLMTEGSFSNSTLLAVGAGAFLDVTIRNDASLNLNNGQTLSGSGTVNGTVNALPGSTINPGSSVGTLNVSGNLNLAGTLLMELNRSTVPNSDRLNVSGATVYGGTLATTNIGAALQVNDTFQLFPSGVSGFTSFNFATHDANNKLYTWQNNITTLGSIKVLSVTNAVSTTPTPITFSSSGGSLDLSWPADHTGWTLQTNASALTNTNGWFEYPAGTGSRGTNHVVIPISSSSPQVLIPPASAVNHWSDSVKLESILGGMLTSPAPVRRGRAGVEVFSGRICFPGRKRLPTIRSAARLLCAALVFWTATLLAAPPLPPINTNNVIVITNALYNAKGDGVTTNTTAIQNAINAATLGGVTNGLRGGVVEIPPGVFLSGPLTMKSLVNLRLDNGAILKMLPFGQYPTNPSPPDFIAASGLNSIAITGPGVIEGQGAPWWAAFAASGIARPKAMFAPSNCRTVLVENVTLQSPPNTHISLRNLCREVTIQGITINTTSDVLSDNTDGIDVNATNCLIQNCSISCGDDHVAMGGDSGGIVITNCTFGNGHGVSIGSHTDGGLQNLLVINSTMTIADSASLSSGIRMKSGRDRGGFVRNLTYLNVALTNVQNPIFISSYYPDNTIPANPTTDAGSPITTLTPIWRDITISNVTVVAASGRNAGRIYGLPEMLITNLTLSKVTVKADKSFDMYHVRNARFIDTQFDLPASVNTFNLYNVDLTLTNTAFNTNLVKIGGWSSASISNQLAFFNTRVLTTDSNVLTRTTSLTLGNALLTVTNHWNVDSATVFDFTLGASNATVAVTGNLTLRGTLNVNAGAGFTNGSYTLFTYGGSLTWGAPVLGTVPSGYNYSLDTNTAGKVQLLVQFPPPATPTNLVATPASLAVNLAWSPSVSANAYNLKRSTLNGGPYSVIAGGLVATNYFDSAVTNVVTYYYVVSALNAGGESAESSPVAATPKPSLTPINVTCDGSGLQLQLSWPADHIGWSLQAQTNSLEVGFSTNWQPVPGSNATNLLSIPIDPANGSVLFRLVYPPQN